MSTVEITIEDTIAEVTVEYSTIEVDIDSSVNIAPFVVTGVVITPGETTQIDTNQTARKPRQVSFYDEVKNENIDISIKWTARQTGNWYIDIPSQPFLTYTNITVSWI